MTLQSPAVATNFSVFSRSALVVARDALSFSADLEVSTSMKVKESMLTKIKSRDKV